MQRLIQRYTQDDLDLLNTPDVKKLLKFMYTNKVLTLSTVDDDIQINEVDASIYLYQLLDLNFVQRYGKVRADNKFSLTYKGKQYIRNNIL